jgi:hypothetical protein
MLMVTISYDKYSANAPYAVHLGKHGFYNAVDFARHYNMAVELAHSCARAIQRANNGAPVAIYYSEDFLAPAKEIARI